MIHSMSCHLAIDAMYHFRNLWFASKLATTKHFHSRLNGTMVYSWDFIFHVSKQSKLNLKNTDAEGSKRMEPNMWLLYTIYFWQTFLVCLILEIFQDVKQVRTYIEPSPTLGYPSHVVTTKTCIDLNFHQLSTRLRGIIKPSKHTIFSWNI